VSGATLALVPGRRSAAESLGEIIRRQRELSELSMRQFAQMAGISNPYLSQIEHGLREPSERVLEAIAEALSMSTDTLYHEAGIDRDFEPETPAVIEAIRADARLTGRQRQALIEIYESFTAAGDARPRRRKA
jgi:transcriptional regulator with XRE-family HTH domain